MSISIDQTESLEEKVCLIDGDSLLYYEMGKPTLEEAVLGFDARLATILSECKTTKYVGFLTSADNFRYSVDPMYKSHRKNKQKPIIYYALLAHAKNLGFKTYSRLEADDLVSYYHHKDPGRTLISSPDKDVLEQCEGIHFNYQKCVFVDTSAEHAEKFLWKQVLMGDSTDHIQGIPGVGVKTAENWLANRSESFAPFVLKKYIEKFGEVEGIYEFHKTYRLVCLLKTDSDIRRVLGNIVLPPLTPSTFNFNDAETDPAQLQFWPTTNNFTSDLPTDSKTGDVPQ